MDKIGLLLIIVFVTGCAVQPLQYDVSGLENSSNVVIEDLRPPTEVEQKVFSYMITNEAYGIFRNKENAIDPNRVRLLQHRIYEKFGASSEPIDVKLHHFVTYTNNKSGLRKGAMFGVLGAIAANSSNKKGVDSGIIFVDQQEFDSSIEKEYTRAFYTEQEYPKGAASFVVYLDAEINGSRTFIKKISPTVVKEKDVNAYVAAIDGAIEALLSNY